jgi:hypothetical protein
LFGGQVFHPVGGISHIHGKEDLCTVTDVIDSACLARLEQSREEATFEGCQSGYNRRWQGNCVRRRRHSSYWFINSALVHHSALSNLDSSKELWDNLDYNNLEPD